MAKLVVANEKFLTAIDGEEFDVNPGDHLEADHKLVKKNPHLSHDPVLRFPIKAEKPAEKPKPAEKAKAEPEHKALSNASIKGKES